jgi:hypothetical protein
MQTDEGSTQDATVSKSRLLIIVSASVLGVLAVPVIIPHILHPYMIYHIFLHLVTVIISLFLSIVSVIAVDRTHNTRILLMTFGFLALVAAELVHLLTATQSIMDLLIPVVNIEMTHIILLTMVTLFSIGVLKVNR